MDQLNEIEFFFSPSKCAFVYFETFTHATFLRFMYKRARRFGVEDYAF